MALCHELIKAPRTYQSLTKRNKAQQSLTQSVWKLNRAWFKAGTPVFTVCHHLTRFVKMSQDLLRSGMKIWHEVRRFHQDLTHFVTLSWRTLTLSHELRRFDQGLTRFVRLCYAWQASSRSLTLFHALLRLKGLDVVILQGHKHHVFFR